MGRPSNAAQRRQQIVEAAARVIARKGYAGASVSAMAREAGLAPGLVHYHFESKQAVLLALVAWLETVLTQRVTQRVAGAEGAHAWAAGWLAGHLSVEGAQPEAVQAWLVLGHEAALQPEVRVAYEQAVQRDLQVLAEVVGMARARQLWCGVHGLLRLGTSTSLVAPGAALDEALTWLEGWT